MATQQPANSMDAIASLMQLFSGAKSSSTQTQSASGGSSTQTTGKDLDEKTLSTMLQSALESNQGLAAVTQGQKGAGLYNSSTNRLLANDLLSRLTARVAEAGATETQTKTTTPSKTTTSTSGQQGGLSSQGQDNVSKLALGLAAFNKIGGTKTLKGIAGTDVGEAAGYSLGGGQVPFADLMSANLSSDPISAINISQGWTDVSGGEQAVANVVPQSVWDSFDSSAADYVANDFAPQAAEVASDVISGGADVATSVAEDVGNFPVASVQISKTGGTAGPSSSEILAEANSPSADTTSISNANASNAASVFGGGFSTGTAGLGTATQGISYGSSTLSSTGSLSTGFDLGSGVEAAGGTTTSLAGSGADAASSSGGSILGYIGPVMDAFNAQNNPEGEQNPDYRKAVGGAVLNYFGFGWATPIVDAVARPVLNAAMEAGTDSMGTVGAVLADPIGAPLSGEYDVKELIGATLDPGNIFGGNEGGSVGAVIGAGIDPIGAALGGEGVFKSIVPVINKVDSALSPGRVVCTELALAGDISMEKYSEVIQPAITLRGRILLGYHVLGVPAVRKMRANSKFREAAIPYVNAYLDHKLGKWNLTGFLIKSIGEPLCYLLSFFNTDPDYYKVLYPYRRDRNGT